MDIGTVGGIVLAIACILGGQALEGGHAGSLVQATAAIIVLGGTMGAVLVSFPMSDVKRGLGPSCDQMRTACSMPRWSTFEDQR